MSEPAGSSLNVTGSSSATVSAEEASKLLVIRRRDFFDIIRKDHAIAVKLLWSFLGVLTERLRATNRELGEAREKIEAEDLPDALLTTEPDFEGDLRAARTEAPPPPHGPTDVE